MPPPEVVVLAGVAGSGKTTVGALLAERLGWDYAEADAFHPPANIDKMRSGRPLTDADRLPWLRTIATWIDDRLATGRPGVVSCSALKRRYRDLLLDGRPGVRMVFMDGDRDAIAARMRGREGHFLTVGLLDTQFADLEPPAPDENVLVLPADAPLDTTLTHVLSSLNLTPQRGSDPSPN